MKNYIKNKLSRGLFILAGMAAVCSCTDSFLKPDPLSFYEPETTFNTESGLQAVQAMCDRHLRTWAFHYASGSCNISIPLGTEYLFSELSLYGKTDGVGGVYGNFANQLQPTSGMNNGDDNRIMYFWEEGYTGIKHANTIISNIDKVSTLSETAKNEYRGRAYFHRAYRYLNLVMQFGDIPLVSKVLEAPKRDYKTTKKEEILKMITLDMEKAVDWVPSQKDTRYIGMVNKEACRQLLIKCYLSTGQFEKAEKQADILIDESNLALMKENFGIENDGGEPETWEITRNVIWDLHRPENKLIAANKEVIMGMPNCTEQSFVNFLSMRIFGPFWGDTNLKTPDSKTAGERYARNNGRYEATTDFTRAFGRGIATVRATHFAQHGLWVVNGVEDKEDLRHNSKVGNWVNMEDLTYNNKDSKYYGQNFTLYAPEDVWGVDKDGKPVITTHKGDLLCNDTIRDWFDFPHYKIYLEDVRNEANMGANDFQGAAGSGANANWYLYRLAETYLLRAEAKFYQGKDATSDVNEVRKRAKCSQLYAAGTVTIGDIMNERARELYLEEWRNVELTRVSLCLALSGKPDEWGNTYSKDNWDKQQGTDNVGGSYWYQRIIHYSLYNKGDIVSNGKTLTYYMDKRNLFWPIPNSAITANNKAQLHQNYGYDGYDASVPMWETWEEAVADEDKSE
ncbi:RagB/SusD family nutrient uptake outer membrane protein [Bacteroides intestinalis]|uniref:SusD family protein n=1 Tax=Bacteroides intestinalis TaxID=329854 RepID=A0A139KNL8_9BACE|nr:RagB/SusD family nutrient uptake outer membrane protein [Bacteroides intestinalis]KXT40766.1 SusD family protein [Bacteroides intestinalis]